MTFITDDIDEMLSEDDFAITVKWSNKTFKAIANQEFVNAEQMVDDDEQESTVVYCKSSFVSGAAFGDAITVDGVSLFIRGIQPDATGITMIVCSDTK